MSKVDCEVSTQGEASMELKRAVLVYERGHRSEAFATIHDVGRDEKGAPVILPGVSANLKSVRALARALVRGGRVQEGKLGFIDPQLIYWSTAGFAWWVPPQVRRVWFRCAELGGEVSAEVPHPGLVFSIRQRARNRAWSVWAVKGTARPTAATELWIAPYFNVWRGGKICTGTVPLPTSPQPAHCAELTDAFFRSYFTHPNEARIAKCRAGVFAFWRDMLAGKHRRFPSARLQPLGRTLGSALSGDDDHD